MIVKEGTISRPGIISSTKATIPAACPILPLYIRVISQPANGAHSTSEKSPIKGSAMDSIPIPSKRSPKSKCLYFLSILFDIFVTLKVVFFRLQQRCQKILKRSFTTYNKYRLVSLHYERWELISFKNSFLVSCFSNCPLNPEVVVTEFCFCTPRIIMHM